MMLTASYTFQTNSYYLQHSQAFCRW